MSKQKIKFKIMAIFVVSLIFVVLTQAKVNAANEITSELTQSTSTTKFTRGKYESSIISYITSGKSYKITDEILASSQNMYCIDPDTDFVSGATYSKSGDVQTYSYSNKPDLAYIFSSGENNVVNGSGQAQLQQSIPQRAIWTILKPNHKLSNTSLTLYKQAKAYANFAAQRVQYKKSTGKDYKEPTMVQTNPTYNNNLAGPYIIDYMMGEFNGTYVCGIIGMTMKDENGKVIKYSTKDLGSTPRWYIANSNGTALTTGYGTDGNLPKPNQEFYIKVVNCNKNKVSVSFKIEKIEVSSKVYTLTGQWVNTGINIGSYQCSDCKYKTCGKNRVAYSRKYYRRHVYPKNYSDEPKYYQCPYCKLRIKVEPGKSVYENCTYKYSSTSYGYCGQTIRDVDYTTEGFQSKKLYCHQHYCQDTEAKRAANPIPKGGTQVVSDGKGNVYTANIYCAPGSNNSATINSQPIQLVVPSKVITEYDLSFEIKLEPGVDLSLRKFITGLNGQDVNNRVPQVDVTPLKQKTGTTAIYNHTKEPVGVKVGDQVEYTIRVYNEGSKDVYAQEVTDYLPSNLEFVSSVVDGVDYKWTESTQNGRTVLKTTYLSNKIISAFSENGTKLDYEDLKVICKVKDTTVANEKLTNIVEVTSYKDESGNIITKDRDSQPKNVNLPENDSAWQNYNGAGQEGNYIKGQQDDDDFEKLVLYYTDIEGTVWVDCIEGKQEDRDNILTGKDTRFEGIDVILYQDGKQVATTKTDSNGKYKFNKLEVNKTYEIKFGYGGQQYKPVSHKLISDAGYISQDSAGYEIAAERNALNAKFFEVVNKTTKLQNGTPSIGLSYDKNGEKYTSTIIRDRNRTEGEKLWQDSKIWATTGSFSGTIKNVAIHNINLGLYERAQINFGILTDIASVDTTIKGQTQTFTKGIRDAGLAMNVEAKVDDIKNNKTYYNQAIYKSDYNYRIEDYKGLETVPASEIKNADELEVYATYRIDVKNYSANIGQVTELVHYYTTQYEIQKVWYEKGTAAGDITYKPAESGVEGYNAIYLNGSIRNVSINPNESMYIYIRYKVNKDNDGNILLGEKYTYTEITGYSSQEGLIDINSEPGNMDMKSINDYVKTYEDDTDRAPGLNLVFAEDTSRQLAGFVFEDMVAGEDAQGVKIGDGIYNSSQNDKKIDGVRIQLIELVEANDGKTYEYIWQEMYTGDGTVSYMDRNGNLQQNKKQVQVNQGEYNFTDILPGNYIVRFIYGDTVRTLNYTGQDFKSTKYVGIDNNSSSAKDNKERRKQVMDYSTTITNEKGKILSATSQENPLHTELLQSTWMNADTVETLKINIDTQKYPTNINFGLIRRPKTELTIVKEIAGLKVTHNGIIYVDTANGIETGLKKITNGYYSLELDDELLNGAVLEATYGVKIVNTGEKDTLYNYFEGDAKYGANQTELITTSADLVYDYPQNIGYDEEINPDWTTQNIDFSILSKEVQEKINNDKSLVITTSKLTKALKPGEETENVKMITSKLMSADGGDDMIYSNVAEIVQVTNKAGRRDEKSIPGDYVPLSHDTEQVDTDDATAIVRDPEGSKAPEIYYILSITIGAMLIVGIVFIKKFVNKK